MSIQEPYIFNGQIAMFGNFRTIYQKDQNNPPKTGFVIINDNLDVQLLTQHSNNYFTTISVNLGNTTYIFISFYCPSSEDLTHPLDLLASCIQQLQHAPILITGDFNAKSHTWHSPVEDPRGYQVEEFMNQHQLTSLNTSPLPTFSSTNGDSWIDICLGSRMLTSRNITCNTLDIHSTSDHNYIEVKLDQVTPTPKYCISQSTNWDLYYNLIQLN
ncbi:uncharacterized protein [Centruroides vittatus]|uniref:uncharacterized protein n=1 Tax=Centruroides vittatus TaxID=120091 RepID=UPI0035108F59